MKILIVEDDFTSRILIEKYLSGCGSTDSVGDGEAAVEAFQRAVEKDEPYDLVCLDIMLPKMDGQEVLKRIRGLESEYNMTGSRASKIIMTTALGDPRNIITAFHEQCEGYLTKPIEKKRLIEEITKLGLIKEDPPR